MKYSDEYRDPALVERLYERVRDTAADIDGPVTIMEICGTHTHAIGRFGIKSRLPENVRLISGPGCPVCVTAVEDIDRSLSMARLPGVILTTFGDMIRVPGTDGDTLERARSQGADVRMVASVMDALNMATADPDRQVIFLGIGFETTAPTVAATLKRCLKANIENFSVFSAHKVIPPAIQVLLDDPELAVSGFLCPGHVSTILGVEAYEQMPEHGRAAVITGFEPTDILEGVALILEQIRSGNMAVEIQYARAVNREGNPVAQKVMEEVFRPSDARWRGLGDLPGSGLALSGDYVRFDVFGRFDVPEVESREEKGCLCGEVLTGRVSPGECPLFRTRCTPANPIGPCMVSREGTCAAYYRYY